jgi:hypothetical protein
MNKQKQTKEAEDYKNTGDAVKIKRNQIVNEKEMFKLAEFYDKGKIEAIKDEIRFLEEILKFKYKKWNDKDYWLELFIQKEIGELLKQLSSLEGAGK